MSSCLVIQSSDAIYIGSDTAISTIYNNELYRLNDNGNKLFKINDLIIFCSGNLRLSYTVMDIFKKSNNYTINNLQQIAKDTSRQFNCNELEILMCSYNNNHNKTVLYQISPYNNFDIIERYSINDETLIWSAGIKVQECSDIACNNLINNVGIVQTFQNTFDTISFEGVGGNLKVYEVNKYNCKLYYTNKITEKDNLKYIKYICNQSHLIIAENLVGKVLLSNKLYVSDTTGQLSIVGNLMSIKDSGGNVRVQLGNYDTNKWGLRIVNKNGNVILDDMGQQVFLPYTKEDNLDANNRLQFLIRIPPKVQSIREAKLSFKIMNYRAYEKSIVGGSSSRTTSADGGNHYHTMFHYFGTDNDYPQQVYSGSASGGGLLEFEIGINPDFGDPPQDILTYGASGNHSHNMEHSHENNLQYGIIQSTPATNVGIYVDGAYICGGYNSDTYDIELKNYLQSAGYHTIELSSSQNGRLNCDLEIVAFVNS